MKTCPYCWRGHDRKRSDYCSDSCRKANARHVKPALLTREEAAAILRRRKTKV